MNLEIELLMVFMSDLVKWSGSKDSQSEQILSYFPKEIENYYEPFLGGGSIFLSLLESDVKISKYCLSDVNKELIGIYKLIKKDPTLLSAVYAAHYKNFNSKDIQFRKDYFNEIREKFNEEKHPADFYWIMRTTTNGMPRYNRKGEFNNSCHFSRPGMNPTDVQNILFKYHKLFRKNNIEIMDDSYQDKNYHNGLVYLDPPYENTKGMYFGGFDNKEFINWINKLDCKWVLSYDGKVNDTEVEHISPNYKRKEYLISGNSSFRRVIGNSKDSVVSESLYLNF